MNGFKVPARSVELQKRVRESRTITADPLRV